MTKLSKENTLKQTKDNIQSLSSFKDLLKVIFKFTYEHKKKIFFSLLLTLIAFSYTSFKIGFSNNTITEFLNILNISYDLSVNMFGIIFTAYGLYQALSSKTFTKRLMNSSSSKNTKRSLFEDYNIFFIKTSIFYLFMVILNYALKIIIENIDPHWHIISFTNRTNNIIASLFILFYIFLNVYGISLIRSVLFNIYQAFNLRGYNISEK